MTSELIENVSAKFQSWIQVTTNFGTFRRLFILFNQYKTHPNRELISTLAKTINFDISSANQLYNKKKSRTL